MPAKLLLSVLLLSSATGAGAQEIAFSFDPTAACLTAAEDGPAKEACIGKAADACMEAPAGQSTVGMGFCLGAEADSWDARLNAAYKALMKNEEAAAKDLADLGSAAASPAVALRDMERAWIAYRTAACAYEASQWGGGTGAGPAATGCFLDLTGRQALALEGRLASRQEQ